MKADQKTKLNKTLEKLRKDAQKVAKRVAKKPTIAVNNFDEIIVPKPKKCIEALGVEELHRQIGISDKDEKD